MDGERLQNQTTVWVWSQASPTKITQYGFDYVRGDKAHIITGGYSSLTKYVTIKPGDVLSVTVRNMQVTYKLNGQTVHHEYVWSLRAWRFCIKYGKGETPYSPTLP